VTITKEPESPHVSLGDCIPKRDLFQQGGTLPRIKNGLVRTGGILGGDWVYPGKGWLKVREPYGGSEWALGPSRVKDTGHELPGGELNFHQGVIALKWLISNLDLLLHLNDEPLTPGLSHSQHPMKIPLVRKRALSKIGPLKVKGKKV